MQLHQLPQQENIFTVSKLNSEVRSLLEKNLPFVWVEGEISNFAAPHSGHWYFSLKDSQAQVRCAMFRLHQRKLNFLPKDGMHVLIKAKVSLYENRGEFQLIAEDMEERGEGKLQRAFEATKKKLHAAGLFEVERKKLFPLYPKCIGVITSATGAAIRDILNVLCRRYPCAPIIIYPTLVQGTTAAPNIVSAIQTANKRKECDALILARGGGSLEDLWPFNEEIVAYAIYASELPIISGVGHEVDFTIADFVADKRAPTPSAAAEIITPDIQELLQAYASKEQQIKRQMINRMNSLKQQIDGTTKHLLQQHPKHRLHQQMQHLDFCENKFTQFLSSCIYKLQLQIQETESKLQYLTPKHKIIALNNTLHNAQQKMNHIMVKNIHFYQTKTAHVAAKLDGLSPLATLQRGFAIATDNNKRVITQAKETNKGDQINVRLLEGSLRCEIIEVKDA